MEAKQLLHRPSPTLHFISILYKSIETHTHAHAHTYTHTHTAPDLQTDYIQKSLYVSYLELQNTFLPIKLQKMV